MPGGSLVLRADEPVGAQRERRRGSMRGRERLATLWVVLAFVVAVAAMLVVDTPGSFPVLTLLAFVGVYALVSKVEFEVGTGVAVPTQLVLVPMLFALPRSLVPVAVALGFVVGSLDRHALQRGVYRSLAPMVSAWHAIGPALVLLVAHAGGASWSDWWIYVLALLAQFVFDLASSAAHQWLALGHSPREHLSTMSLVWLVDLALSPIALGLAIAVGDRPALSLVSLPLVFLIAVFA